MTGTGHVSDIKNDWMCFGMMVSRRLHNSKLPGVDRTALQLGSAGVDSHEDRTQFHLDAVLVSPSPVSFRKSETK